MVVEQGGRRRPLVVLTASPFHGHMTPILQLPTALHAKEFPIAIAHCKLNLLTHLHPDFIFLPLSDNLFAIDASSSFTGFLHSLNSNNQAESFRQHLTRLIADEQNREDKSMVVIYDHLMFFAGGVAIDLNLESMVFRTCSAAYFPAFHARQQLYQRGKYLEQDKPHISDCFNFYFENDCMRRRVKSDKRICLISSTQTSSKHYI